MTHSRRTAIAPILLIVAVLLGAVLDAAHTQAGPAASFVVDSTADEPDANVADGVCSSTPSGKCTLRAAVMQANATAGADSISVPAGTFLLTIVGLSREPDTGDLDIKDDLIITGAGADRTIIDGNGGATSDRIFEIISPAVVTISGVTIQGGGHTEYGGGIFNWGTLTLTDSMFSGNSAPFGAAIQNSATLKMSHVTIENNSGANAGLSNGEGTTLNAHLVATDVSIINNKGSGFINGLAGDATLRNVTIAGNSFTNDGGGIYNRGTLHVTNSTISSNRTKAYHGGGIFNSSGALYLTNVTVTGNSAPVGGGGALAIGGGTATLKNTILANSPSGGNCLGAFTSLGHNLSSDNTCAASLTATGDLNNKDPLLGVLQDNGGTTFTHALLWKSAAIDHGDNNGCPQKDQRGTARPLDGNSNGQAVCDIGAYEYDTGAPPPTITPTFTPPPPTPTATPTLASVTINVNTTDDELVFDGNCSLREAIKAANTNFAVDACPAGGGSDTINLPAGKYMLGVPGTNNARGSLGLNSSIKLVGAGREVTFIDANGSVSHDRAMTMGNRSHVEVSGLTLQNVNTTADGGALVIGPDIDAVITDVRFRNNQARLGGGILNLNGASLTLKNAILEDNTAEMDGGGLDNASTANLINVTLNENNAGTGGAISSGGPLTFNGGTLDGNTARRGGALYIGGNTAILKNLTLSNNSATGGGAIQNRFGAIDITTSLFRDNGASEDGGAIDNSWGGSVHLTNVTFSNNLAGSHGGAINIGFCDPCPTSLVNVTMKDNTADQSGGGLYAVNGDAAVTLMNTILDNGPYGGNCAAVLTSLGHNLSSDNSCSRLFTAPGDRNNTNPLLGPLQDNGGSTFTHALLPNSPAIDRGTNRRCPETDQRGVSRPQDSNGDGIIRCDIGAYEVKPTHTPGMPTLLSPSDGLTVGSTPVLLDWSNSPWAGYYQVELRAGSTTGPLMGNKKLFISQIKTPSLAAARWYYWRVRACNDLGCTSWTPFWKFAVTS